jgi:hypothetical protein
VTGPKWLEYAHTGVDRMGSYIYASVLGEHNVRGVLNGKGPITVLPLSITARYRLPVGWPDSVLIGCRPAYIDPKGTTFGETYEAFSLKTGQLAFVAEYNHVHIEVKMGRAVSFPDLVKGDEKWQAWIERWQGWVADGKKKLEEVKVSRLDALGSRSSQADLPFFPSAESRKGKESGTGRRGGETKAYQCKAIGCRIT